MGNAESAVDSDDLLGETSFESKDEPSRAASSLQFSALLDANALKEALSNYPNADLSPIANKEEKIRKWLTTVNQRGADAVVTLDEFVDSVSEFDIPREDCELFFHQLDRYSEDSLSAVLLMSALGEKGPTRGLVGLMPCRLEPSMCDAYVDEKKSAPSGGSSSHELLLFLKRNRCPSSQLTLPALSVHQELMQLRDIYIRACFAAEEEEGETDAEGSETGEGKGHKVTVAKCYSQVTVSSNSGTQYALTDNNEQTYWQSNGSPRTHWVRVHMLPGIKVSEVLLSVNTSDESYMPATIAVSVGNSPHYLKEIRTINIPKEFTGKYSLVKNINAPYKFIQVNVRRCHRDGCDCRIRGIYVKGSRYVKEPQPSVLDSMVIWNLNLMTATAQAAMPVAPQLRTTLLNQTRSTICSLRPLALSPSSRERPTFLDSFVMEELTKFVHRLCRKEEDPVGTVEVDPEELATLLQYMLITGNTNGILDTLQQVLENMHLLFPCRSLLKQLDDVAKEMREKHAVSLRMQVVQCDGGQKDEEYKVDNCITLPEKTSKGTLPASAKPYVTEEGKKVVNMILEHHQHRKLEVQCLSIMGQKGDQAPAMGLVFFVKRKDTVTADFFERFVKYDAMSKTELAALVSERKQMDRYSEDVPVAFFGSTEEVEHTVLPYTTEACRCVYIKFIGTVGENAERMGIQRVTISGKAVREEESLLGIDQLMSSSALLANDLEVSGSILLTRILGFLIQMLVDLRTIIHRMQVHERDLSSLTEGHLCVEGLSLEKIWSLYVPLAISPDPSCKSLSHLCLMLLLAALPFMAGTTTGKERRSGDTSGEVSQTILSHLCTLIDSAEEDPQMQELAKNVVVSGVPVFFPTVRSRQEHLMGMFSSVGKAQVTSWMLKFKGLCQYFVEKDSFKLLQLPYSPKAKDDINIDDVVDVLDCVVGVACNQTRLTLKGEASIEAEMTVELLQSIQGSLFRWCSRHLDVKQKDLREATSILVINYSLLLMEKAADLLRELRRLQQMEDVIEKLPKTVIGCVVPQLLFFLNSITFPSNFVALKLLRPLHGLLEAVRSIEKQHPHLFMVTVPQPDSTSTESDSPKQEDGKDMYVLNMWVREASSGAVHEVHKEEKFLAPGATRMTVDFDQCCRVERQYDKLEFIGADTSNTQTLQGAVGSSDWPSHIEFKGNELTFRFNVISSSGGWAYKYIVRAYGPHPQSMGPLADLQLSIAHLMGRFCSFMMGSQRQQHLKEAVDKDPAEEKGEELSRKAESWLTSSDAWKKLFRGGITEKFTRTLSTRHSSIPAGSEINEMLTNMASGISGREVLEKCKAMHRGPPMHYGGAVVDQALHAVFAALVWHSQQIREELAAAGTLTVTQGMRDAYAMAQFLRRELVEARQKVVSTREAEEDPIKQSKMDEDGPVKDCLNKALFLLRFAGLARSKTPLPVTSQRPTSFVMKYRQWQRTASAASVDKDDVGAPESVVETERSLAQKYPSFCIVMDFVRKTTVTKDMVEQFLSQRQKAAKELSAVLNFVSDHLRSTDVFSRPSVVFLSQLFSQQHHFPEHYVHELEGCGLELEGHVRHTYYDIITQLLELLRSHSCTVGHLQEEVSWEKMVVKGYLLHLLDTHWRDYDMQFIGDQHLPEFLLSTAIQTRFEGAKSTLPKQENEDEMLARYERFKTYLTVLKSVTSLPELQELMRESSVTVDEKECHLFIVSSLWHKSNLSISVQCDGCRSNISSTWYRDLEARDLDLCSTCYFERHDRRPQLYHKDHKFLEMRFMCDLCRLMISSHRLHCDTKEDYDLCLGCYRKEERSGMLNPKDKWTLYPLILHKPQNEKTNSYYSTQSEISTGVKLSTAEKDPKTATLKAYLAQHSFLLFTHICLSTAGVLNQADSGIEDSYLHTIAVIYLDCLKLLTFCLRSALAMSREKDVEKETTGASVAVGGSAPERQSSKPPLLRVTSVTDHPEVFDEIGEMEKEFCFSMFDRLMGLLALMLPKEKELPKWVTQNPNVGQLLSERLLPTLIDISRSCKPEHAVQGLSVLLQFLLRINPSVADRAVETASQESSGSAGKEESGADVPGLTAVKYLCSTGAHHLEKSDFTSASVVARVVILLANCASWKPAVAMQLKQCLDMKLQEMNMSAVFSLYTLAGFPSLPCIGSVVRFGEKESERRAVITDITKTVQTSLITLDKREPMLSPLTDVTLEDPPKGCVESSHIPELIHLLKKILKIERTAQEQMTTQNYFILGLVVKAIRVALTVVEAEQLNGLISDAHLMAELTRLAQKPTGRDKKWLLPHLEVYLVNSYRHKSSGEEEGTDAHVEGKRTKEDEEEEEKKGGIARDPKEGVKGPAADMFDTMVDAFDCSHAVLRAAYDISEGNVERWLMMLQDSFVDNVFKPSDEVLEKAKEWEPQPVEAIAEKIQATGDDSGLVSFTPRKIDIKNITAVKESGPLKMKITVEKKEGDGVTDTKDKKMAKESLEMLFRELKTLESSSTDATQVYQTAEAVAVLQARELIVSTLTHWPWGAQKVISLPLVFGSQDIMKTFGMIDLISNMEPADDVNKITQNIMEYGDPQEVSKLVLVAAECMGELIVGTQVRESPHPLGEGKAGKPEKFSVTVPNASSVTVTFDSSCSFKGTFTLTSGMGGKEVELKGTQLAGKIHILPGDAVKLAVCYDKDDAKSWGWRVNVVGSQTGRFETGFLILRKWLSNARSKEWGIPLADLWQHLVIVACQNTSHRRLQMIGLILEILMLYKDNLLNGGPCTTASSSSSSTVKKIDFGLLRPLWKLYYSLLEDLDKRKKKEFVPEVVQALSELFLVVESFSKELGMAEQLMSELWVDEKLMAVFAKGVRNVAFLSIGVDVTNKASTTFLEAKPQLDNLASLRFQGLEEEEEETASSGNHTPCSDSDDTSDDDDEEDDTYDDSNTSEES